VSSRISRQSSPALLQHMIVTAIDVKILKWRETTATHRNAS
jgi:hypothetical protein